MGEAEADHMSSHKRIFGALGGGGQSPLVLAGGAGASPHKTAAEGAAMGLAQNPPAGTPWLVGVSNGYAPSQARYCKIADTDSICIDANLSDELTWPSKEVRSKGGVSEWPIWGWVGALRGRTGRVVYVWDRRPKDGKEKAAMPKKFSDAVRGNSRHAGFRIKDPLLDAMEKTMLLLEIDQHYVPILEEVPLIRLNPKP